LRLENLMSFPFRRRCFCWTILALVTFAVPCAARAQDSVVAAAPEREIAEAKKTEFLRFTEDKAGGKLESAIATYRNADGVTVHLVAALHVGERSYYEGLSRTFEGYDVLLYEMVKPKGMGAPVRGQRSGGVVSTFQRFLKDVLELEFQLDAIDYSAPNFVHADLDVETFFKLQEERGESLFSLMLRSMMSQMSRAGQPGAPAPITLFDILAAMNSPDSARQYKLLFARQFQDIEEQLAGLEGPNGTVLLTERNKAALRVLQETVASGKKNIGVFYGAGHMRGLEDALLEKGFKRAGVQWRLAWDMEPRTSTTRPTAKPAVPVRGGVGEKMPPEVGKTVYRER
jgi:hypothetical protein